MRSVEVDDDTYELISFVARTAGLTHGAVIARLLGGVRLSRAPAVSARDAAWTERAIYGVYRGERVEALFLPATRRVTVTSGPLSGESYATPSAAAAAVVAALNPDRRTHRISGLRFWRDVDTNARLEAVEQRPGPREEDPP